MRRFGELMMGKTEIVGAPDQIHASLKRSEATCRMAGFARQAGKPLAKGPIQALDERCVQDSTSARTLQQLLGLRLQTMSHAPGDLDDPFFLGPFDHRPNVQVWPDLKAGSSPSSRLLDLFSERSANTVGVGSPSVCQDEQRLQAAGTATNLGEHSISQGAITRALNGACYPQACRDPHGQPHPGDHLASFHAYLVGLNMHQIQLSLLHQFLVHLLAMGSRSITPRRHGSFIQTEGMHDGLDRASIGQQGHDDDGQLFRFPQPLKHGASSSAERLFAHLAPIALSVAIMDHNRAQLSLASCATHRIGAKYIRRVHWL